MRSWSCCAMAWGTAGPSTFLDLPHLPGGSGWLCAEDNCQPPLCLQGSISLQQQLYLVAIAYSLCTQSTRSALLLFPPPCPLLSHKMLTFTKFTKFRSSNRIQELPRPQLQHRPPRGITPVPPCTMSRGSFHGHS